MIMGAGCDSRSEELLAYAASTVESGGWRNDGV